MKKCLLMLIMMFFVFQLNSEEELSYVGAFQKSETYPDYELIEKVPIEKSSRKKEKFLIKYEYENNGARSVYDENNKILSLKPDIYNFYDNSNFAISENGTTVFNSYENLSTSEYRAMIKWVDKQGKVINTYELDAEHGILPHYIQKYNFWLIFTYFENAYQEKPSDPTSCLGGILVFDELGNKKQEINIPSEYNNFIGYSTSKTGEMIIASYYKTNYSDNSPRYPYTVVFNINGGLSQVLEPVSYRGVFSEDNRLYHSFRTLVDVTTGEVIFKTYYIHQAFPASRDTGIIALIDSSSLKILDYRNNKYLLWLSDKRDAKIYSVSPDASEVIIHDKGYAYKYKKK